MIRHSNQSNNL